MSACREESTTVPSESKSAVTGIADRSLPSNYNAIKPACLNSFKSVSKATHALCGLLFVH
jgi:hypothetical protein